MTTAHAVLVAATLAAAAITPTIAVATTADTTPKLRSSPQMRMIDSQHATLSFAADQMPVIRSGKIDAGITMLQGRVSALKAGNRHGYDRKYTAKVSSTRALRLHAKYTMTFRLGNSTQVKRAVKLYLVGDHG